MTNLPPPRPPGWVAPPPPPPPRGGLLGLWLGIAAIVVLVLGVGVAVVVLQPWDDDSGSAAPSSAPSALSSAPSASSSAPSASSSPSGAPSSAPATEPVTSDLDGDGLGDATAVFGNGDGITRLRLTSRGSSFAVAREPLSSYDDSTWADFDGDGRLDQVSWAYRLDGRLVLTSDDLDFDELDFRLRLDHRQPFVTLKAGDFDGDGAPDLVAHGATGREQVAVWVLLNEGGRFAAPEQWMRMPHTTYATTTLLPGDFTGDGVTDVVARVVQRPRRHGPADRFGLSVLASSGKGFVPAPLQRPTTLVDDADLVVGDFAGDGRPRLLLLGPGRDGLRVQALRARGGHLVRDRRYDVEVGDAGAVTDAVTSDVDGDGVDDVVYTTTTKRGYDGFRVLQVRDLGRAPSRQWARTPACRSRDCTLYFENGY